MGIDQLLVGVWFIMFAIEKAGWYAFAVPVWVILSIAIGVLFILAAVTDWDWQVKSPFHRKRVV